MAKNIFDLKILISNCNFSNESEKARQKFLKFEKNLSKILIKCIFFKTKPKDLKYLNEVIQFEKVPKLAIFETKNVSERLKIP